LLPSGCGIQKRAAIKPFWKYIDECRVKNREKVFGIDELDFFRLL